MFDTELFINEVSIRPPLWNMTLKEYSDRDRKCKLWIEVGSIMVEKWAELSDQEKNKEGKFFSKLYFYHVIVDIIVDTAVLHLHFMRLVIGLYTHT